MLNTAQLLTHVSVTADIAGTCEVCVYEHSDCVIIYSEVSDGKKCFDATGLWKLMHVVHLAEDSLLLHLLFVFWLLCCFLRSTPLA